MDIPEDFRDRVTQHQKKLFDLVFEGMSWRSLKDLCIDVYVSVFTQEALGGLITFYRSPVGQAFTGKMPELTKGMMDVAQSRMQQLGPRIMSMAEELAAEVAAEGRHEGNP